MKRLCLVLVCAILVAVPLSAGESGVKQSIAYVKNLQTPSGGFLPMAAKDKSPLIPTLRATSAAVRALHYFGADTPNKDACAKFVASCFDAKTGGFSDVPQGKPDVFTTAVGIMAVAELKMPVEQYGTDAIKYLGANAKSFEEIRIAAAGLEQLKTSSSKKEDWLKEIAKLQNADGTFGKGPGQARATGGSVVAILRLGGKADNVGRMLDILKDGQRRNGGYGKDDDAIAADLETTYRVMRLLRHAQSAPPRMWRDPLLYRQVPQRRRRLRRRPRPTIIRRRNLLRGHHHCTGSSRIREP